MRLVEFQNGDRTVYVNPDQVTNLAPVRDTQTDIYFGGENNFVRVKGDIQHVAQVLTGGEITHLQI
jgi:hypothetical protein